MSSSRLSTGMSNSTGRASRTDSGYRSLEGGSSGSKPTLVNTYNENVGRKLRWDDSPYIEPSRDLQRVQRRTEVIDAGGRRSPSPPIRRSEVERSNERPGDYYFAPPRPRAPEESLNPKNEVSARNVADSLPMPRPQSPNRRVDLVHDPSDVKAKDITVELEMPVEEDFEHDLEDFCRLTRLGRFKDAKKLYQEQLGHLGTRPYIIIQYGEMLIASGDYKAFRNLSYPAGLLQSQTGSSQATDQSHNKLFANFELLKLLSQPRLPHFAETALRVVQDSFQALGSEGVMGSTEIQLLTLCLKVLRYLQTCSDERLIRDAKIAIRDRVDFKWLYHELLHEDRIWDFKDLLEAAVPVFGWADTAIHVFGTSSFPTVLETISRDWSQPTYDESTALGLLDLYTSLILQDPQRGSKNFRTSLLFQHAKPLAELVQANDAELMRTRPFIQWILARSVLEMEAVPQRPDGIRLEEFGGLSIQHGSGVHLPVYVPRRHSDKPDWDMFFIRSNAAQRLVVEVALQAARHTGDYTMEATSLKLLILQSQDPKRSMDILARLQLDTQDDKEGFLSTCLSKYLVPGDVNHGANIIQDFARLDKESNGSYLSIGTNAPLLWARSMIHGFLVTSDPAAEAYSNQIGIMLIGPEELCKKQIKAYGPRLPVYITNFVKENFHQIHVPLAMETIPFKLPPKADRHEPARIRIEERARVPSRAPTLDPLTERVGTRIRDPVRDTARESVRKPVRRASSSSYDYSDNESLDIRYTQTPAEDRTPGPAYRSRRPPPPPAPHYIRTVTRDVRDHPYFQPETTIIRTRARSAERRSSPPRGPPPPPQAQAQAQPVVITNRITKNKHKDRDSEYSSDESIDIHVRNVMARDRNPQAPDTASRTTQNAPEQALGQMAPIVINNRITLHSDSESYTDYSSDELSQHMPSHRRRHHHRRRRSSSTHSYVDEAREKWELERTREQLRMLQASVQRKEEQDKRIKGEVELIRTKDELNRLRQEEETHKLEQRYKDMELSRLKTELEQFKRKAEQDRKSDEKSRGSLGEPAVRTPSLKTSRDIGNKSKPDPGDFSYESAHRSFKSRVYTIDSNDAGGNSSRPSSHSKHHSRRRKRTVDNWEPESLGPATKEKGSEVTEQRPMPTPSTKVSLDSNSPNVEEVVELDVRAAPDNNDTIGDGHVGIEEANRQTASPKLLPIHPPPPFESGDVDDGRYVKEAEPMYEGWFHEIKLDEDTAEKTAAAVEAKEEPPVVSPISVVQDQDALEPYQYDGF
ncbi:hypothetical protein B0H63DRAFT_459714 [Podospora didyma]|uniref:Uncharacterized protein n=1 Tax=Podospora didyma TaxID=330526 RepID=A0AAE0P663_9PEZI|nr:hypothetical protein B0H63DRAFT_459714 [Podospora didyma]